MENGSLGIGRDRRARELFNCVIFNFFSFSKILILLLAGCAAPGAPIARQPAVAQAINDLGAQQTGNSVVLTFTVPKETAQGDPLQGPPEIKIYREFFPAAANAGETAQPPAPGDLILTVTPQMYVQYRDGNRLRIPTALAESDVAAHAGEDAMYVVRTRVSTRDSADSNFAEVRVLPAPEPIEDLREQVTASVIELSWTAPQVPAAGALGPAVVRYRVYRTQVTMAAMPSSSAGGTGGNVSTPAYTLLGETASPAFNDANFTFGLTYQYTIRTVAQYDVGEVESEDSKPVVVTPRDTFPPATPEGLVGALVPGSGGEVPHADLSWAISPETDVAGYNVYRSDAEPASGRRLNCELLLTPAFRDISVVSGHRYYYRVTAVDRSGNESAPSAAIAVTLPGPNVQEKH
jgi:hypothetical protein